MVLDDAPKLNAQRPERVIECKVQGAINLLQIVPAGQHDQVIFFSSAANAFLDAHARHLSQATRIRASVINLGLVEDVGILAGGSISAGVAQIVDHAFLVDEPEQCRM